MHDRVSSVPGVASLENVWFIVVEFMSIDRHISGVSVVRRGFDQIDRAPLRHLRCDVRPMLTIISRDLDEAIVCAYPDGSFCYWRFREREDGIVIFYRSDVVR